MNKYFLVLGLTLFSVVALATNGEEAEKLVSELKSRTRDLDSIKDYSSRIQKYISSEKNKEILDSHNFKELLVIQSRLLAFQRVQEKLDSTHCRIDKLSSKDQKTDEILNAALAADSCGTYSSNFLTQHPALDTLQKEIELIEGEFYKGVYTLDKNGKITFPWEWTDAPKTEIKSATSGLKEDSQDLIFRDMLFKESLKNSFSTFLNLELTYTNYNPKYFKAENLVKEFCSKKQNCPESLKKYFIHETKSAFASIKKQEPESAATEINAKLEVVNALAKELQANALAGAKAKNAELKKKNDSFYSRHGAAIDGDKVFYDLEKAKRDYAEYRRLHTELVKDGPGLMAMTNELRPKLGLKEFSPEAFKELHTGINPDQFKLALTEAKEHVRAHSNEIFSIYESKDPTEEKIAKLLDLNPAAAGKVLLREPNLAPFACKGLKELSSNAMKKRQLRDVVNWGGMIVGGAMSISGFGAIPMVVVGAVTSAPDMTFQVQDLIKAEKKISSSFSERDGLRISQAQNELSDTQRNLVISTAANGIAAGIDVKMGVFTKPDMKLVRVQRIQEETRLKPYVHKYDSQVEMRSSYIGEDIDKQMQGKTWKVRYLTKEEQLQYQAFVIDGKLVDAKGKPLSGSKAYIFILDHDGAIYMSNEQVKGKFHHSTLAAGKPVASAGEMILQNGKITFISNKSGHYRPGNKEFQRVLKRLKELGADFAGAEILPFY